MITLSGGVRELRVHTYVRFSAFASAFVLSPVFFRLSSVLASPFSAFAYALSYFFLSLGLYILVVILSKYPFAVFGSYDEVWGNL